VDAVLARPWPPASEVRLVWVIELPVSAAALADPMESSPEWARSILRALRQAYERRIREVVGRFRARPELPVTYEMRDPGVKRSLLAAIEEWRPDLLVAGFQRVTTLGRMFLGSVAHTLVSRAPCHVLIVKVPPADG
jgi:nucleotide-binding universal stress UspA family protein